jgi:DNA-binding transcriptional ArsR family regulator
MQAVLQAINEPRRRAILHLVARRELAAGDIHRALDHLRVLSEAGLVIVRRDGRHRLYRARLDDLGPLRRWLEDMWNRALDNLTDLAEAEEAEQRPRPYKGPRK